jgi:hypothetical protein
VFIAKLAREEEWVDEGQRAATVDTGELEHSAQWDHTDGESVETEKNEE